MLVSQEVKPPCVSAITTEFSLRDGTGAAVGCGIQEQLAVCLSSSAHDVAAAAATGVGACACPEEGG
jgi:hypothetical protein